MFHGVAAGAIAGDACVVIDAGAIAGAAYAAGEFNRKIDQSSEQSVGCVSAEGASPTVCIFCKPDGGLPRCAPELTLRDGEATTEPTPAEDVIPAGFGVAMDEKQGSEKQDRPAKPRRKAASPELALKLQQYYQLECMRPTSKRLQMLLDQLLRKADVPTELDHRARSQGDH